jgi:hypothetical protein
MEKLTLTNTTGDASITTGGAFNAAFASGATIATGTIAATKDVTFAGGLANSAIKLTIDATSLVGTATEAHVVTTGSGADTITFTGDDTFVGVAAASGTIVIGTGAGNDKITLTIASTLLDSTGGQFATLTPGTGADTMTFAGKVNGATATSNVSVVIAAGDSPTTAHDTITGFLKATAGDMSDGLEFGTSTIGTLGTSTNSGTILTHAVGTGIATFDDASVFAAALVINAGNLADVLGYLAANSSANEAFAFEYDSSGSGVNDSTYVFHNGTTDDLVLLAGVTGSTALLTTNATTNLGIFVS